MCCMYSVAGVLLVLDCKCVACVVLEVSSKCVAGLSGVFQMCFSCVVLYISGVLVKVWGVDVCSSLQGSREG